MFLDHDFDFWIQRSSCIELFIKYELALWHVFLYKGATKPNNIM